MLPAAVIVEELSQVVSDLTVSAALWSELRDPEVYREYAEAFESAREFFESTADAQLQASIVSICQLLDDRNDTVSIRNFVTSMQGTHSALAAEIEARIFPHQSIFDHIERIRSKVYAHRDRDLGPEMVFAAAPFTPNSLGACVEVLTSIGSDLCFTFGLTPHLGTFFDDVDARRRGAVDQLHQVLRAVAERR